MADKAKVQTQAVMAVATGADETQLRAALAVLSTVNPKSLTPEQRAILFAATGGKEREPVTHSKTSQVRVGEINEREGKLAGATLVLTFSPSLRRKNRFYPLAKMTPALVALAASQGSRETTYREKGNKGYWLDDGTGRAVVEICKGWTEELTLPDGTPVARLTLETERDLDEVPESVLAYLGLSADAAKVRTAEASMLGAAAERMRGEAGGVTRRTVG